MNIIKTLAAAAALSVSLSGMVYAQTANEVSTMIGGADFTTAISTLDAATSVNILPISGLDGAGENQTALSEAMASKAQDIESLRARVMQSKIATDALTAQGYTVEQVVAISASGDGAISLYVIDMMDGAMAADPATPMPAAKAPVAGGTAPVVDPTAPAEGADAEDAIVPSGTASDAAEAGNIDETDDEPVEDTGELDAE